MTVKPVLTNREIKNKLTGIDLYVSDYQEIPHKIRNEFLYHVIVVTNLFYYKTKEYRQSDVVQFMVSKSFEEFEDLYHRLFKRFPSVNFPKLPSKMGLSNKTDEKLQCMDKVMKLVATTQKLASSTMVIKFLKGHTEQKQPQEEEPSTKTKMEKESMASLFNDDYPTPQKEEASDKPKHEEENLFEVDLNKENSNENGLKDIQDLRIEGKATLTSKNSLFDDDGIEEHREDDLFSAPPSSSVLRKSAFEKTYEIEGSETNADLLNVDDDDLDDLLMLSKSSNPQSSIKAKKPNNTSRTKTSGSVDLTDPIDMGGDEDDSGIFVRTKSQSFKKERLDSSNLDDIFSKNKKKGLFDDADDDDLFATSSTSSASAVLKEEKDIEQMGQDDIMNYIQSSS